MDYIPKELEENQLKLEVSIDPETKCMTMKTHLDDEMEPVALVSTELLPPPKDPLTQPEQVDFEKLSELDQLIYMERARLLYLPLPNIIEKSCKAEDISTDSDESEADSNHRLTPNEKSRLRMKNLREKESVEEHEFKKFRGRVRTLKTRLMQKLRNFDNETYLNEVTKRTSAKIKQKRLELKANETPDQYASRRQQDNLARRKLFLINKAFSTPEDILRARERRTRYAARTWSRRSEEQRTAKRKQDREKAKAKRRQNNKEWKAIQKFVKGQITEEVKEAHD